VTTYREIEPPTGTSLPGWIGGGSDNNPPGTYSQGDGRRMNTWVAFTAADYATWRGCSLARAQAMIDAARGAGIVV
jgi:hypothetical protein